MNPTPAPEPVKPRRVHAAATGRELEPPPSLWGWPNVRWGLREGWWFGKRYLLLAVVMMLLGATTIARRGLLTVLGVLAFYFLGIPIAGGITGALRPLCRTNVGAAFVGFVAALPLTLYAAFLRFPASWGAFFRFWYPLGFSVVFGALGGLVVRKAYNP